jgi:hypothetical protein
MGYIQCLLENCIYDKICIYSCDTTMYSMSYKKKTINGIEESRHRLAEMLSVSLFPTDHVADGLVEADQAIGKGGRV